MALHITLNTDGLALSEQEESDVRRRLQHLERRLAHHPEPAAVLALHHSRMQRRFQADLRIELGPLGAHLVSHQGAETLEHVVRLAVEDVERQLERLHAGQRGEASFGVPSRRPERKRVPRRET